MDARLSKMVADSLIGEDPHLYSFRREESAGNARRI